MSTVGDGKTHYIKQQLAQCAAGLTVAVNEAFTPLNAINKLRTLPLNQRHCGIFFNFTMLPPGVRNDSTYSYYMYLCSSHISTCMYYQELIETAKPVREHVTTYTAKFKHGGFFSHKRIVVLNIVTVDTKQ